jgi:hypothetical protein
MTQKQELVSEVVHDRIDQKAQRVPLPVSSWRGDALRAS